MFVLIMADQAVPFFTRNINLASGRLGAKVLSCSDEFFAKASTLVKDDEPVFLPGKYTSCGKWMDGWETRRSREAGHCDWGIIRLGAPGVIHGLDIDTSHFLGNHPPYASVDASMGRPWIQNFESLKWQEILPKTFLNAGSHNFFKIQSDEIFSHVRLNIFPDGGIARMRSYGEVRRDWKDMKKGRIVDLASAVNGGQAVLCSDMFFSRMENLILPGRARNMGDGWETKRSRDPDHRDWAIIRLAAKGVIRKIIVDTLHFKGNYPESCSLEGCTFKNPIPGEKTLRKSKWVEILPKTKLYPHREHIFKKEIIRTGAFTHVRLTIYPDGGVSRLRVLGELG